MSIEQDRDAFMLQQLSQAPEQGLKTLPGGKAKPKDLLLDPAAKKAVEARLINRHFIAVTGKGKDKKYTLTTAGAEYLKSLPPYPPPPPVNVKFIAFVLLSLLAKGDRPVPLKELKATLSPADAKTLGATKNELGPLLESLAKERAVEPSTGHGETADQRQQYRITEAGKRRLAGLRQHVDVSVKLNGAAINQLAEIFGGPPVTPDSHTPSHALPLGDQAQNLIALAAGAGMSDEDLIREAKMLMTSHGANGLLPIFQLRRHVRKKFGDRAAGVEEFDKRLKRLRGERLDLISLFDPSSFSPDQLNEGVQGAGELFFYVRNPR